LGRGKGGRGGSVDSGSGGRGGGVEWVFDTDRRGQSKTGSRGTDKGGGGEDRFESAGQSRRAGEGSDGSRAAAEATMVERWISLQCTPPSTPLSLCVRADLHCPTSGRRNYTNSNEDSSLSLLSSTAAVETSSGRLPGTRSFVTWRARRVRQTGRGGTRRTSPTLESSISFVSSLCPSFSSNPSLTSSPFRSTNSRTRSPPMSIKPKRMRSDRSFPSGAFPPLPPQTYADPLLPLPLVSATLPSSSLAVPLETSLHSPFSFVRVTDFACPVLLD
jgi:hypothetical protein